MSLTMLLASAVPLIFIVCVIILVVIACFYFAAKRKYKQKVDAIASQTKWLRFL